MAPITPVMCREAGARYASAQDASARQVRLRFLIRRPLLFTIPMTARADRAAENAGAADLRLSGEELPRIDGAFPVGPKLSAFPQL